jgi:Uma2 family endonuclease
MTQAISKLMSFDEFIEWKPENRRYELHNGVVFEMQPTGKHEEIVEFLQTELILESRRLQLPYRFLKNAMVKSYRQETGYLPDIALRAGIFTS